MILRQTSFAETRGDLQPIMEESLPDANYLGTSEREESKVNLTLFEKLGGEPAIHAVVDGMY